jgi:hypothetical protein
MPIVSAKDKKPSYITLQKLNRQPRKTKRFTVICHLSSNQDTIGIFFF